MSFLSSIGRLLAPSVQTSSTGAEDVADEAPVAASDGYEAKPAAQRAVERAAVAQKVFADACKHHFRSNPPTFEQISALAEASGTFKQNLIATAGVPRGMAENQLEITLAPGGENRGDVRVFVKSLMTGDVIANSRVMVNTRGTVSQTS